jgi:hypothetical protein
LSERGRDGRFFFAHVQKAAGTSLFVRLQRQFEAAEIYPDESDVDAARSAGGDERFPRLTSTLLVSHLLARYAIRGDQIRLVAGHFPVRTTELLGDDFRTITVLRDPIDRTLSALRHQRERAPEDGGTPIEELYEDPVRFHGLIHNHMVKMLSLSPEEILAGDGVLARVDEITPTRLSEAKQRVEEVDVLGLHDRLEELGAELTSRFGWSLGAPVHANRTEPVEVSAAFRRRIAADNAADVELFEHAAEVWRGRQPRR